MVSPEGIFSWKLYPTGYWMFKMCWKDWSRFERSDGNVACIRVVDGSGLTKEQLNYECYAHNAPYYASLAGVYTVEESVWMREEAAKHSNGQPLNYWISGTVLSDDTCPANYTNVHFKMISPEGVIHPWKLGANGSWNFRFCFEGWKRFERSDNRVVCIKIVNESSISKYDLGQKCYYEKPFYASVAGVHSVEESVWMREEAAKYTSSGSEPLNYWTSGVRDGTCEDTDSYDKKNHFKWEDGMTTGVAALTEANSELSCKTKGVAKNCLVVMSQGPNRPQIFSDFECESTVSIGGGFCIYDLWRGIE
ncbi:unnamed protein product [Caenorhabditis brenneri]